MSVHPPALTFPLAGRDVARVGYGAMQLPGFGGRPAPPRDQAVSLLASYRRRTNFLAAGGDLDKAPGVSCKRKDLLRLTLQDYQAWADPAQEGLAWAAQFLGQQRIFRSLVEFLEDHGIDASKLVARNSTQVTMTASMT